MTAGGWNQRRPPGVVRCACALRQEAWARLLAQSQTGCCTLPCCTAPRALIVATRETLLRLRAQCLRGRWACRRCGAAISAHHHNFECVDACTVAIRGWKARRGWSAR